MACQGCIKLSISSMTGGAVSPKRPCLGWRGRLGEASPPKKGELDAALKTSLGRHKMIAFGYRSVVGSTLMPVHFRTDVLQGPVPLCRRRVCVCLHSDPLGNRNVLL